MDTKNTINHQALTEALLDEQGLMPNVDAEWKRQTKRHASDRSAYKRIYLRGLLSGIAATVVVVLAVGLFWLRMEPDNGPLVTYSALPSNHQVFWQSGSSQPISLTDAEQQSLAQDVLMQCGDSLAATFIAMGVQTAQTQAAPEMQVITTPPGCSINVTLPDSTVVWLSGNSRLTFPSYFAGLTRNVSLEGEAYFKAAHDADHPLLVETSALTTRVLGTEFFVSASLPNEAHVALIEGSVEVSSPALGTLSRLSPGQSLTLDIENGTFTVNEEDMTHYISARDGYFYFDGVTLRDMMAELGQWYNVNVVFEDEELLNLKMRYFCRRHDSVEESVALLNNLRRIHAKVVDNTVYIK